MKKIKKEKFVPEKYIIRCPECCEKNSFYKDIPGKFECWACDTEFEVEE